MRTPAASQLVLATIFLTGALPSLSAAAPVAPSPDPNAVANPTEQARQALDRVVSIRFDRQMIAEALAELGDKAKVHIVLDGPAAQQFGVAPGQAQVPVRANLNDVKARAALRILLDPYNLTFVVVGDEVVVVTPDEAARRQMGQRVSVHLDKTECAAALKQIARETGVNLALDPRAEKEASAPVSLQVEDVPLQTAVQLLSEMAGLKPVRVGDLLFVTTKKTAAEMRGDPDLVAPPPGPAGPIEISALMFGSGSVRQIGFGLTMRPNQW